MKWLSIAVACLPVLAQCASNTVEAGYHVIYSYSGIQVPSKLLNLIKQGKVGGVLLFGENVDSNLAGRIQDMQDAYRSSSAYAGSPLLIMTDQEGGQVRRLPGGPYLSEKEVGATSDPANSAHIAGEQAAGALKTYNVNSNLAPVLGVYRQEGDFLDQYGRSYSSDPDVAAECAGAFVSSHQSHGAIATAKHWPGLGLAAADENTDRRPVTLHASLNELRSIDEKPYHNAIQAGVDMIMPSWAIYPALDSQYPSGLSSAWLKDELRGRLGYNGVVISDTMGGGSITGFGDWGERALLATNAGQDLLLGSGGDVDFGEKMCDALIAALNDGSLDNSDFHASSQRILNLRQKI